MLREELEAAYVRLLKLALAGLAGSDPHAVVRAPDGDLAVEPVDPQKRRRGADWPAEGVTMIGLERLDSLQRCVEPVLRERVPGDLIETGVWRGGASIFMRALL